MNGLRFRKDEPKAVDPAPPAVKAANALSLPTSAYLGTAGGLPPGAASGSTGPAPCCHAPATGSRRALLLSAGIAVVALTISPARVTRAQSQDPLDQPLRELYTALEAAMRAGKATPFPQRFNSLAPVVDRVFDLETVLKVSIGLRWSSLDADMRARLLKAFRRFTIATYVANFDKYDGERFRILPDIRDAGTDRVVETEIVSGDGQSIRVDYVMREIGGGWRAVDVLLEGSISRVAVQRSDFRKILAHGDAEALIISLRRKIADLSGGALNFMIAVLASVTAGLVGIGLIQALAAAHLVAAFATKARVTVPAADADSAARPVFNAVPPALQRAAPSAAEPVAAEAARPSVSVLKPLHGAEPLLAEALATFCRQDYPDWQIVFGVQDAADPAVAIVRDLQDSFPAAVITVVVDPRIHGANRKVGNLINMLPAARHDILVIADSDIHVQPDYLDRLIVALLQPRVGLVTTLYAGLPAPDAHAGRPALPARLGATHITHDFLPSAVLARALGRQDCLGATMGLRRRDLDRIGGFHALVHHLADDNVLGRRIAALGLRVALADTVPLTTVPENTCRALFRHELRWARTIRALEPAGYAASVLQLPLVWALLTIPLAGGALWSFGLFLVAWGLRAVVARRVDRALRPLWTEVRASAEASESHAQPKRPAPPGSHDLATLAFSCPVWLLPLRDILSVAVMLTSYGGRHVDWRGHGLRADTPPSTSQSVTFRPLEGTNLR